MDTHLDLQVVTSKRKCKGLLPARQSQESTEEAHYATASQLHNMKNSQMKSGLSTDCWKQICNEKRIAHISFSMC